MLKSRLKCILVEVFKSLKHLNPPYIEEMIETKDVNYNLRDPQPLNQPKRNTTNYGLKTFSYLGTKLWNDMPNDMKCISDTDIHEFKSRLKHMVVPTYEKIATFYV